MLLFAMYYVYKYIIPQSRINPSPRCSLHCRAVLNSVCYSCSRCCLPRSNRCLHCPSIVLLFTHCNILLKHFSPSNRPRPRIDRWHAYIYAKILHCARCYQFSSSHVGMKNGRKRVEKLLFHFLFYIFSETESGSKKTELKTDGDI